MAWKSTTFAKLYRLMSLFLKICLFCILKENFVGIHLRFCAIRNRYNFKLKTNKCNVFRVINVDYFKINEVIKISLSKKQNVVVTCLAREPLFFERNAFWFDFRNGSNRFLTRMELWHWGDKEIYGHVLYNANSNTGIFFQPKCIRCGYNRSNAGFVSWKSSNFIQVSCQ